MKSPCHVGFVDAIKQCFKNYVNFEGRSTKSEFWWFVLFNIIALVVLNRISGVAALGVYGGCLTYLWTALLILPGTALCLRRLHDIGKSGWSLLIAFIPIAGLIILLVWYAKASAGDNKWGSPAPKSLTNAQADAEVPEKTKSDWHLPAILFVALVFLWIVLKKLGVSPAYVNYIGISVAYFAGLVYVLVKKRWAAAKIIAIYLIADVLLSLALIFASAWLFSDKSDFVQDWVAYDYGNLNFSYPEKIEEMDSENPLSDAMDMKYYFGGSDKNFVMYSIYDFKMEINNPDTSNTLMAETIKSVLKRFKAEDIEFVDVKVNDNTISTGITYKLKGVKKHGYGIIYFEENHSELLLLIAYEEDLSKKFIEKFKASIVIK